MDPKLELTCPCCEAMIVVDRATGEILFSKAKTKTTKASLEEMVGQLETQKADAAKRFERELESQKDRSRLLEEKFREAMKRADKSDTPVRNPLDLD